MIFLGSAFTQSIRLYVIRRDLPSHKKNRESCEPANTTLDARDRSLHESFSASNAHHDMSYHHCGLLWTLCNGQDRGTTIPTSEGFCNSMPPLSEELTPYSCWKKPVDQSSLELVECSA